ncbi:hypothetical protein G195_003877 [Phytophthora kernoviae 00238/432]|uniref:Uncharacterized protein n=2 Tax=Phytophthora kernoviae TaxID=325452 RepID=A0A8T0M2D7_9STRA|nr:hypothetical protein G195_003877 [Phytophthora kernoviae 00238/432]KAG2526693.1 hypothetical protein JM16_003753 [Phytophthora kernoviae]
MPDIMDGWTQKPWSVTEEMWKRKAKGLEDQYQRLLSDHQDLRLEKAKMMGELRVLQRYKETAEDTISREVTNRKIEHKDKISATTKLEQYIKKYERECERVFSLERENAFLMEQVSNIKGETEKRLDLLKELEDSQKRNARQKEKLREMEVVAIEHENTILELKEKNQKLKRKLAVAEESGSDKADEAKNLAVRLAAVESAWEAARGQNKTALHELKKKESLSKELESVKSETKHASYRIHALDVEVETAQSKLRQKDRTIEELRETNSLLKKDATRLTARVEDLSATLLATREVIEEKDTELERKHEQLRNKKTEVKTLERIDDSSKDRIEDLVCQVSELQQQLLDTQKEYLRKVKKDELTREKLRSRDRAEIAKELETMHKSRREHLSGMRVNVKVHGLQFVVPCGEGTQTCRWLGLAVAQRYALAAPHGRCRTREDAHIKQGFFLPAVVIKSNGQVLQPEKRIADSCKDNEALIVQLQQEVPVNEIGTPQFTTWAANAFFPSQKRNEAAEHAQDSKADSKQNSSLNISTKQSPQQVSEGRSGRGLVADAKGDGILPSAEELKQYARAEMLQQVNSGQFLSDMEVEAAFLYDWSRLHPEDIEKDPKERELLQELLMPRFSELNAAYMHYATGSSELAYGMNGAEFSHFLHECELIRVHDAGNQKIVERVISQCLRYDTLVAMHDRGTLSRVGFLHALLRVVQTAPDINSDSSSSSFIDKLDSALKTNICPTITRLTSGPFRDHSHHDKMVAIFQEAKPKLLKLYAKYAQERTPRPKKSNSSEPEDTPSASAPAISSTWPLLLSAPGLTSMLYDCGMFCSGTPEEQEALFYRALEQSFSGIRDVERIEDRFVVFAEFLEVTARVALAVLKNENELPPRDAIKLALDAMRSLPLKPEGPRARK